MVQRPDKYDGGGYLGIHDDGGEDDAPLSPHLEYGLAANESYLWKQGHSCGAELTSAGSGKRQISAWDPAVLAPFPIQIPLDGALSTIRLSFAALVDDGGSTGNAEATFELKLRRGEEEVADSIVVGTTTGSGNDYESQLLTLDTSNFPHDDGWGFLTLTVQTLALEVDATQEAGIVDTDTSGPFSFAHNQDSAIGPSVWMSSLTGSRVSGTPNTPAVAMAIDEASNPRSYFYVPSWANQPISSPFSIPSDTDNLDSFQLSYMSYTQCKNWHLSFRYDDEPSERYGPKPSGEMFAREAVRGEAVSKHPENLDTNFNRYRLSSWGSFGQIDSDWDGTARRWPTIWADDADGSFETIMQSKGVTPEQESGELSARMHFLPMQFVNDSRATLDSSSKRYRELAAELQWTFRATLEQLDPANPGWSNATTIAQNSIQTDPLGSGAIQPFPCWANAIFDSDPTLQPIVDRTFFGMIISYWGNWSGDRLHENFREGLLYDNALSWVLKHFFSIPLEWSSVDVDVPTRLRIDARYDSTGAVPLKRGSNDALSRFALSLVSMSAWQRGVL